jgi:sugar-specific transcriptional regulator TrmB
LTEKAGCVGYFLSHIQKHIISKTDEESANLLNKDDDVHSESESLVSKGATKATFEYDESSSFLDITKIDDESIGHLIPLKCGHNGNFSVEEHTIYENHLKLIFEHLRDD